MPRDPRTYITLHDGMPENPKVEILSDAAFRATVELWCWCSRNKTDGIIPIGVWNKRVPKTIRGELLTSLYEEVEGGFAAHDYLEHQRSAQEIEDLSRKRSEAGKKGGESKANALASATANARQIAKQAASKNVAETDTDTNNKVISPPESLAASAMCELLASLIEENGSLRPKITKAWMDEARRLIDLDKREQSKAENLIRWSQSDTFWRKNILSMPTFRKQYDKIRLAAMEAWEKNKSGPNPDGGIDADVILGRDRWQLPAPPEDLPENEYIPWAKEQRAAHEAERIEEAKRRIAA